MFMKFASNKPFDSTTPHYPAPNHKSLVILSGVFCAAKDLCNPPLPRSFASLRMAPITDVGCPISRAWFAREVGTLTAAQIATAHAGIQRTPPRETNHTPPAHHPIA